MKFPLALATATLASVSAAADTPIPSVPPAPSGFPPIQSGSPMIPKACQEIPQLVGLKPLKLLHQFHEDVCEKNCSATINEHNEYVVNNVLPQIIPDLDKKLDISASDKKLFTQVRTEAVAAIKKSCGSQGDQPLCNDPKGLFEFGACAMQATTPIYQKEMKQLAGALQLTDSRCEKLKALDSDPAVWNKIIPGYIEKFAQQCESEN